MQINGKRIPFMGEARHATNAVLGGPKKRFSSGGVVHQKSYRPKPAKPVVQPKGAR